MPHLRSDLVIVYAVRVQPKFKRAGSRFWCGACVPRVLVAVAVTDLPGKKMLRTRVAQMPGRSADQSAASAQQLSRRCDLSVSLPK